MGREASGSALALSLVASALAGRRACLRMNGLGKLGAVQGSPRRCCSSSHSSAAHSECRSVCSGAAGCTYSRCASSSRRRACSMSHGSQKCGALRGARWTCAPHRTALTLRVLPAPPGPLVPALRARPACPLHDRLSPHLLPHPPPSPCLTDLDCPLPHFQEHRAARSRAAASRGRDCAASVLWDCTISPNGARSVGADRRRHRPTKRRWRRGYARRSSSTSATTGSGGLRSRSWYASPIPHVFCWFVVCLSARCCAHASVRCATRFSCTCACLRKERPPASGGCGLCSSAPPRRL